MRISDWSSDVCSSDLTTLHAEYLARHDDRLRRLGPIDQQDARLRLGDRDVEILFGLRRRGRLPLAQRRVQLLLHLGQRRVADDEDTRRVGADPFVVERRELVACSRRDGPGIRSDEGPGVKEWVRYG